VHCDVAAARVRGVMDRGSPVHGGQIGVAAPNTPDQRRKAVHAVLRHCEQVSEARLLLDMLGLTEPGEQR